MVYRAPRYLRLMKIELVKLFREALDLEPGARLAFLDLHCANASQRAEIESLLAQAEQLDTNPLRANWAELLHDSTQ